MTIGCFVPCGFLWLAAKVRQQNVIKETALSRDTIYPSWLDHLVLPDQLARGSTQESLVLEVRTTWSRGWRKGQSQICAQQSVHIERLNCEETASNRCRKYYTNRTNNYKQKTCQRRQYLVRFKSFKHCKSKSLHERLGPKNQKKK